jgi:nucleoid DNA-binding protein
MGKRQNINPEIFKKDLKREYAEMRGITETEAEIRMEDIFEMINAHLVGGNDVKLNNFFNFFGRKRKAKAGKNPQTGADMVINETRTVVAKMTKPLKDRIQGKK